MSASRWLATLFALALAASAAHACKLPLDAFVIALPSSETQYKGFVNTPSADNNGKDNTGYVEITSGQAITWELFWDPTKDGAEPDNWKIVPEQLRDQAIEMQITRNNTRKVWKMNILETVIQSGFEKPIKLKEVYERSDGSGGWGAHKNRVYATWRVPDNANVVMETLTDGSERPFSPSFRLAGDPSKIAELKGVNIGMGDAYLQAVFGPSGTGGVSTGDTFGVTATRWTVKNNEWTGDGGSWDFKAIEASWDMNTRGTAFNPDGKQNKRTPADLGGSYKVTDHRFVTPSDPFLYRVKPTVRLKMELNPGGDWYEWEEEERFDDAADPITNTQRTPRPVRRCRLQAYGDIWKGGLGVATLVKVLDNKPPAHAHMEIKTPFRGKAGHKLDAGEAVVAVIDDNPYFGLSQSAPGDLPSSNFSPDNVKLDLFYSMMVEDYVQGSLETHTDGEIHPPGDMAASGSILKFPVRSDRYKWFTKDLGSGALVAGSKKMVKEDGNTDASSGALTVYGNGQLAAMGRAAFRVTAADIEHAMGLGQATGAQDGSLAGETHDKWDYRPKFFARPTDALGNKVTSVEAVTGADNSEFGKQASDTGNADARKVKDAQGSAVIQNDGALNAAINFKAAITGALTEGGASQTACACAETDFGTFGYVDATSDEALPSVIIYVKDTKYNKTYVFNDQWQGWWGRDQCKNATKDGGKVTSPDNDGLEAKLGGADQSEVVFDAGAGNPGQLDAQKAADWHPFQNGTRSGVWVDEDTRLVFKAVAFDNLNPHKAIPRGNISFKVMDQPSGVGEKTVSSHPELRPNSDGQFTVQFMDPNFGGSTSGECSVTVTAKDESPAGKTRSIKMMFYVRSEKLAITTLEETTGNRSNR